MRWISLGGVATALALSGTVGCSHPNSHFGSGGAHPASVVVDFHHGRATTAACSGTLLSADLVLTSAHCAAGSTGAVVRAPDAGGRVSLASRVFFYGWDRHADATSQNDLALLVLESPIRLAHYAVIQKEPCDGCGVVEMHRTRRGGQVSADVAETEHTKLAKRPSMSHPLAMFAPIGTGDSGGAVVRTDTEGHGLIVGVTIGDGHESGGSYVARVDDPDVQRWVRDVAYVARGGPGAGTTGQQAHGAIRPLHFGVHPLDDGTGCIDDGTGNCDDAGDDGGGAVDDGSQPVQSDNSGDDGGGDDASGDDGGDPSAGDDSGIGGDDSGDSNYYGDDAGDIATGDDGGVGDDGGASGETVDLGGAPASNGDDASDTTGDDGGIAGDDGGDDGGAVTGDDAGDDGGADSARDEYAPTATIAQGSEDWLYTTTKPTYWMSFPKDDGFGKDMLTYIQGGNANANVISAHGNPGFMEAVPSPQTLQKMATDGQPFVLASCYGGADNGKGGTNASDIADDAGVDRSQVFACGNLVASRNGQLECDGDWIDGSGNTLADDQRNAHGLLNCSMLHLPFGKAWVHGCH
jgi:hypothetical protein